MLNTRIGENYNANDVINSNDLKKRILNIDSRFRADLSSPTTDFQYKLDHSYKNIIRIRVASVEIPNMFYTFTKFNNTFAIKAYDIDGIIQYVTFTIEEGNYTSDELVTYIQNLLDTNIKNPYGIFMSISLNTISGKITFTNNGVAAYPIVSSSTVPSQSAKNFLLEFPSNSKNTYFGLGNNLGFRSKSNKATLCKPSPTNPAITIFYITAPACLDVVGNTYMFLNVNDLYAVEQKTSDNYIQALAKIIVREDKHTVIYDDGGSFLSNEIIFTSPTDLSILNIKLLDPYGNIVDLCGLNFSFSLEITQVLNTKLYDFYRNYIWLGNIPSVPYKSVVGSAQPLLKGIGPPF